MIKILALLIIVSSISCRNEDSKDVIKKEAAKMCSSSWVRGLQCPQPLDYCEGSMKNMTVKAWYMCKMQGWFRAFLVIGPLLMVSYIINMIWKEEVKR